MPPRGAGHALSRGHAFQKIRAPHPSPLALGNLDVVTFGALQVHSIIHGLIVNKNS